MRGQRERIVTLPFYTFNLVTFTTIHTQLFRASKKILERDSKNLAKPTSVVLTIQFKARIASILILVLSMVNQLCTYPIFGRQRLLIVNDLHLHAYQRLEGHPRLNDE